MIDAHKHARLLLDRCKRDGLVNPVTGEGSPTEDMLAEELLCVESDTAPETEDLAMYVRRLARVVRKYEPNNKLAADAIGLLVCTGHIKTKRERTK